MLNAFEMTRHPQKSQVRSDLNSLSSILMSVLSTVCWRDCSETQTTMTYIQQFTELSSKRMSCTHLVYYYGKVNCCCSSLEVTSPPCFVHVSTSMRLVVSCRESHLDNIGKFTTEEVSTPDRANSLRRGLRSPNIACVNYQ